LARRKKIDTCRTEQGAKLSLAPYTPGSYILWRAQLRALTRVHHRSARHSAKLPFGAVGSRRHAWYARSA